MTPRLTYDAPDEAGTAALAAALARALPDGAVVALEGTLGAGKTRLVRDLAEAEGVPAERVVSPTFVLVASYPGRRPIHHFDAYRLADDDEFLALGPEEYFESDPPGITLIEWADRVARSLPPDHLRIAIEVTGDTSRRFDVSGHGEAYGAVVERLRKALGAMSDER